MLESAPRTRMNPTPLIPMVDKVAYEQLLFSVP
jgi:hypothetical protein